MTGAGAGTGAATIGAGAGVGVGVAAGSLAGAAGEGILRKGGSGRRQGKNCNKAFQVTSSSISSNRSRQASALSDGRGSKKRGWNVATARTPSIR